jgi:hypothetical protein
MLFFTFFEPTQIGRADLFCVVAGTYAGGHYFFLFVVHKLPIPPRTRGALRFESSVILV